MKVLMFGAFLFTREVILRSTCVVSFTFVRFFLFLKSFYCQRMPSLVAVRLSLTDILAKFGRKSVAIEMRFEYFLDIRGIYAVFRDTVHTVYVVSLPFCKLRKGQLTSVSSSLAAMHSLAR